MILYRVLMGLALPGMMLATGLGRLRGRLPRGALAERLGLGTGPGGDTIWLHGASLGEVTSLRGLVDALRVQPGLRLLITCNSATARAMVAGWGLPGVTVALAPYDAGGAAARLIAGWRPRALIVAENELWPDRLHAASRAGVPVIVVGARMSARSFARWQRLAGLARQLLMLLRHVSPQDEASGARLVQLGLPPDRLGPPLNLKAGVVAPPAARAAGRAAGRARVVLAASTHEGEDAGILDAFLSARAAGRFDRLILAPRHPQRAPAIAALIRARGLEVAQRSLGAGLEVGLEVGPEAAPVLLADTLGEMALWYDSAGATVIGGTFADKGGHTPFEPVAHGSAVLHGPSVWNHAAGFAALDAAGAAVPVATLSKLGEALQAMDEARQARLAAAAPAALPPEGDPAPLVALILGLAGLQRNG